jgi:hypothetical protein
MSLQNPEPTEDELAIIAEAAASAGRESEQPQPMVIHPPFIGGTDEERAAVERAAAAQSISIALPTPVVIVRSDEATAPRSGVKAAVVAVAKRAAGLDALRGLFLITMTLGFTIPEAHLPVWMYHRQFPPGAENPVDVAGISWRDLAYASFLFTMAAALPLTLARKLDNGLTEIGVGLAAIKRWGMLMVYALLIGHGNTFFLGYTQTGRVLALTAFVIMAMIFTRRRKDWSESRYKLINRAGWVLGVAFLALSPLAYGKTFSFERIDDIISGLAFASVAGMIIWYATRENLTARLAILAGAVALYLGAKNPGWIQDWWYSGPIPWAFTPSRFSLLTVVIPGTIAGDVILRWMRSRDAEEQDAPGTWSRSRLFAIAALSAAFTPIVTVGLYHRAVQLTTQVCIALVIAGVFATMKPVTSTERMLRSLFTWAAIWLTLGLFLEPSEGGIRKAPETLTYFFTITGTTSMLLVTLSAVIDGLKRQKAVQTLVDVGHNPLLCYVLFTVLLNSVFEMIPPLRDFMLNTPGEIALRCGVSVAMVVLITRYFSRKKIYWRA